MSVLKKLKNLIKKPTTQAKPSDKSAHDNDLAHLNPISEIFKTWITANDWTFQHFEPDDDDDGARLNVFVINFGGGEFDWRLVVQILEKPQLVTLYSILDDIAPKEYRLAMLAAMTERARHLHFGDVELDLSTGELRGKIYFDGEFTKLNQRMLDIQTSQLYRLAEICHQVKNEISQMPTIKELSELLHIAQDQKDEFLANTMGDVEVENDDGQIFYAPSVKVH